MSNGQPAGVAFDWLGNAYVLNIMDENANGNIDVYAPGTTQPEKTLIDTQSFRFFDEAIDARDDVYVGWADALNGGHLDEFAGGNNPPTTLPLQYGFPGGVVLDPKGNLLVVDDDAFRVNVLAPPYTGQPFTSFQIQGASVPCRFRSERPPALLQQLRRGFGRRLRLRRDRAGTRRSTCTASTTA